MSDKQEVLRPFEIVFWDFVARVTGGRGRRRWRLIVQLPEPFTFMLGEGHFNFIVVLAKRHFTLSALHSSHALLQFNLVQLCFVYVASAIRE